MSSLSLPIPLRSMAETIGSRPHVGAYLCRAGVEVGDHRRHAPVLGRVRPEAELLEDAADVGLDGLRTEPQLATDRVVAQTGGHQPEDVQFALGQLLNKHRTPLRSSG